MAKSCGAPQPGVDRFSYPLSGHEIRLAMLRLQVSEIAAVIFAVSTPAPTLDASRSMRAHSHLTLAGIGSIERLGG